jgi:hypothetical protein
LQSKLQQVLVEPSLQKQCRDLSSKLLKTIGNIQELVFKFEASSTIAFQPALEKLTITFGILASYLFSRLTKGGIYEEGRIWPRMLQEDLAMYASSIP